MVHGKFKTFQSPSRVRIRFSSRCTRAVFATPMFTKRSDIFRARSREFSATNPWVRLSRSVRVYGRETSETASALRGSRQAAADANGACAGANIFAPTSKPQGSNFRADTRNSCPCTRRQQLCCPRACRTNKRRQFSAPATLYGAASVGRIPNRTSVSLSWVLADSGISRFEIRVQAYSFTSPPILSALVSAKGRGLDVAVILDKSNDRSGEKSRYSGATFVAHAGIPVF